MTVALLAIGTELTRGELVNTNSAWLASRIVALGLEVPEHLVVDDDVPRIVAALRGLAARHAFVVCTGGLGPTTDDLTAQAAAEAVGKPLVRSEVALEQIRRRFATIGRSMGPSNEKQADLPEGAELLPNADGTAPGFAIDLGDARVFFLPGVPKEMERMFTEHGEPRIAPHATRTTHQIHLRTFGAGESAIGERLAGLEAELPGITLGYRASFPEVEVKVLARAADASQAESLAERGAARVRERLGALVYGDGHDTFPAYLGRVLRDRGLTLALAESCTGGLAGQLITSVPGSSEYLLLDAVTYSNAAKIQLLGVHAELIRAYGAVSAEVAAAMADGVLRVAGADLALSITGIAGPGGGSAEKPVGTVWLALARRDARATTRLLQLGGSRDRIRTLAAYTGLRWVADAALENGR
ncbi:MAG: competence/damage-inducible protein A [Sandaracinaceae bacterium]